MPGSAVQISAVHIFIHGNADPNVGLLIVKSLRPDCLAQTVKPEVYMHNVGGEWPSDILGFAVGRLLAQGITLTETNFLVENGRAFGRQIYVVYLKSDSAAGRARISRPEPAFKSTPVAEPAPSPISRRSALIGAAVALVLIIAGIGVLRIRRSQYEGTHLSGHTGLVNYLAVTPDGKHALSGSEDRTVKVWDLVSGRLLATLPGIQAGPISNQVAVSPDGKRAVMGGMILDVETGKEYPVISGSPAVISMDDDLVIFRGAGARSGDDITVCDLRACKILSAFSVQGPAAVAPDCKTAISHKESLDPSRDYFTGWDMTTGKELFTFSRGKGNTVGTSNAEVGPSEHIAGIAIAPDGKRAVSTTEFGLNEVWDLPSGKLIRSLKGGREVTITPDGARAIIFSYNYDNDSKCGVTMLDLSTGAGLSRQILEVGRMATFTLTPDCKRMVSNSNEGGGIWNLETGERLSTAPIPYNPSFENDLAPVSRFYVSSSSEGIGVWDLQTGRQTFTTSARVAALTPDGKRVVLAGRNFTALELWDLETGKQMRTLATYAQITAIAIAPDAGLAVCASRDGFDMQVWDLNEGKLAAFRR